MGERREHTQKHTIISKKVLKNTVRLFRIYLKNRTKRFRIITVAAIINTHTIHTRYKSHVRHDQLYAYM